MEARDGTRHVLPDVGEARSGQLLARFGRMTGHARLECGCASRGITRASGNPPKCGRGMIVTIELFACCRIQPPRRSDLMRTLIRRARWIAGFALACLAGSLPSCASMGGGGMKYFVSPPFMESAST